MVKRDTGLRSVTLDFDDRSKSVITALALGHNGPDLAAALAIARSKTVLIVDEVQAHEIICQHIFHLAVTADVPRRLSKCAENARETNAACQTQLVQMETLLSSLLDEAEDIARYRDKNGISGTDDDLNRLTSAIDDLEKAINSLEKLFKLRVPEQIGSGGNSDHFSAEFVRAVRVVWEKITGESPGSRPRHLIEFACSIWDAFGIENRSEQPLFDWLSGRFKAIR